MPVVRTKKKCCKSSTRCKKCPVVWHRLSKQGYADRLDKRTFDVTDRPGKKAFKAARAR